MLFRRFVVSFFTLFLSLSGAFARPNNEIPMYGGATFPPYVASANDEFIADILKRGFTRAQGSDNMVSLGWRYYFEKHDVATAMKRFNQAWLLDPDNGDAFHGFAVLVMARDQDAQQADSLFQQGLAAPVARHLSGLRPVSSDGKTACRCLSAFAPRNCRSQYGTGCGSLAHPGTL